MFLSSPFSVTLLLFGTSKHHEMREVTNRSGRESKRCQFVEKCHWIVFNWDVIPFVSAYFSFSSDSSSRKKEMQKAHFFVAARSLKTSFEMVKNRIDWGNETTTLIYVKHFKWNAHRHFEMQMSPSFAVCDSIESDNHHKCIARKVNEKEGERKRASANER